jgi:hypothetical protein
MLDIDLLELAKLARHFAAPGTPLFGACSAAIVALTAGLALIALYIAFAMLMNPTVGRTLFKVAGPMFTATPKPRFDTSVRAALFEVLYEHWKAKAFELLPADELRRRVKAAAGGRDLTPELCYLNEIGAVRLGDDGASARLTAAGIDLHEQLSLKKYETGGVTP